MSKKGGKKKLDIKKRTLRKLDETQAENARGGTQVAPINKYPYQAPIGYSGGDDVNCATAGWKVIQSRLPQ